MYTESRILWLLLATQFCFLHLSSGQALSDQSRTWKSYGGGPDNIHYSALQQINRDNVSRLQVAWTFESGDAYQGSEMECNPIVVDGVLYATTPKLNVVALDASTGNLKWRFDPNQGQKIIGKLRNRGVTYWSDQEDERIFVVARQYLYSLNAQTGKPDQLFGNSGRIDLRDDLGREPRNWVTMTSPAVSYQDLVIIGSSMGETLPASPGDIRAYDVRTGKLRWSFHTIPHPGEFGYKTWPKDAWKYSGAANNWAGMSLDTKRGIVFVPTGSAAFDFYGANRVGDNLFADCLIALDAKTGKRLWHFQFVRHDIWDRDLPAPPSLVTVKRGRQQVDAVAQVTKQGYVFLLDRQTGKLLFPLKNRKVPASDLEGEVAANRQPFPLRPAPFVRQTLTTDMLTVRTPEAHQDALERFKKLRSAGQFVPGSREGTIIFPGFDGGAEWGGPAFDPETGLLYVNANEMAWVLRMVEQKPSGGTTDARGIYLRECSACHGTDLKGSPPEFPSLVGLADRYDEWNVHNLLLQGAGRMPSFAHLGDKQLQALFDYIYYGNDKDVQDNAPSPLDMRFVNDGYNRFLDIDGYPAIKPPWGTLSAINLNTGELTWRIPLGEYPELVTQGWKDTGSENYGGPVVTASGLLFIAATSFDKKFRAFDKATGAVLWETALPAAGNATPSIYEVNDREYVVIAAGGGKSKSHQAAALSLTPCRNDAGVLVLFPREQQNLAWRSAE
jgi:quinoprotein glucose dehydrogenase